MTATLLSPSRNRNRNRQTGVATLMFAVVLLISLTVITFLGARTLITEQAISANEYRSKEVSYAAEAALEYGIGWLNSTNPDFTDWDEADLDGDGVNHNDLSVPNNAPNNELKSGSDTYDISANYQRDCLDTPEPADLEDCKQWLIEIEAQAVAQNDSDLKRRQWIRVLQSDMDDDGTPEYIRVPGSWRDW